MLASIIFHRPQTQYLSGLEAGAKSGGGEGVKADAVFFRREGKGLVEAGGDAKDELPAVFFRGGIGERAGVMVVEGDRASDRSAHGQPCRQACSPELRPCSGSWFTSRGRLLMRCR